MNTNICFTAKNLKMKKLLLSILALLGTMFMANAQTTIKFVVETVDGETVEYEAAPTDQLVTTTPNSNQQWTLVFPPNTVYRVYLDVDGVMHYLNADGQPIEKTGQYGTSDSGTEEWKEDWWKAVREAYEQGDRLQVRIFKSGQKYWILFEGYAPPVCGIDEISVDNQPVVWIDATTGIVLNGEPAKNGLFIKKQGNRTTKVIKR